MISCIPPRIIVTSYCSNLTFNDSNHDNIVSNISINIKCFKHLGEVNSEGQKQEATRMRILKLETALQLIRNIHNRKSLSIKTKLTHCNTVITSEVLYAANVFEHNLNWGGGSNGKENHPENPWA